MKKYEVIYADPPWNFKNKKTGGSMKSGASAKYSTMSLKELKRLDVKSITADNCVLFMWWVGSQPKEAIDLCESWGFKIKTMTGFVWIKKTKLWKYFFGMGFWTRAGSESCLIATKGKPKPKNRGVRSVVTEINEKHSKKPIEVANRINRLCGKVPKLEMFARDKKDGWDVWGDEVESDVKIDLL